MLIESRGHALRHLKNIKLPRARTIPKLIIKDIISAKSLGLVPLFKNFAAKIGQKSIGAVSASMKTPTNEAGKLNAEERKIGKYVSKTTKLKPAITVTSVKPTKV